MQSNEVIFKTIEWYGTNMHHRGSYRVVNWLRRVTNADVDQELVVERGGLSWSLNPSDFVHQDVFWYGTKDTWDVWHVERLLSPKSLIVDIGANFGYYSVHLTHKLGPASRAIAFEPMQHNFERLSRNIEMNGLGGQIKAVQMGLSSAPSRAQMSHREGNSGSAQVQADGKGDFTVELDTLDRLWDGLAGAGTKCDFVKLDVEGHEIAALKGARAVLEHSLPALLLEVDPPRLAECGSSALELQEFFDKLGYRYFITQRKKLVPVSITNAPALVNVLCLHSVRHAAEIAKW